MTADFFLRLSLFFLHGFVFRVEALSADGRRLSDHPADSKLRMEGSRKLVGIKFVTQLTRGHRSKCHQAT